MNKFYFGDSYGGEGQAEQAGQNSDRNLFTALMAAAQQGQALAMGQANRQQDSADRWALNQQDRADKAAMFNANLDQANADRELRKEFHLDELDTADSKLAAQQQMFYDKLQEHSIDTFKRGETSGPMLASAYSDLIAKNQQATLDLKRTADEYAQVDQDRANKLAQGLIRPKKGVKEPNVYEAGQIGDTSMQSKADELNMAIRVKMKAYNEAKAEAAKAYQELVRHDRLAQSSGFIAGDGQIVFQKTGQTFRIPTPESNSPKQYDVTTGTFRAPAPAAPPMSQPAPAPVQAPVRPPPPPMPPMPPPAQTNAAPVLPPTRQTTAPVSAKVVPAKSPEEARQSLKEAIKKVEVLGDNNLVQRGAIGAWNALANAARKALDWIPGD